MNEAKPYPQLLGLVELDQAGTVVYSDLEKSSTGSVSRVGITFLKSRRLRKSKRFESYLEFQSRIRSS
jgi:hypothetical protein